jgi:hypothetical protein
MDVVRHNHKRMQFIVSKDARVIPEGFHDLIGDRWLTKVERTRASLIEKAIQSGKCLPGGQRPSAEPPMLRQTAVKPPGEEDRPLRGVYVRKSPPVDCHISEWCRGARRFLRIAEADLGSAADRGSAPLWPKAALYLNRSLTRPKKPLCSFFSGWG